MPQPGAQGHKFIVLTLHLNPEEKLLLRGERYFPQGSSRDQGGHLNSQQRSLPPPPGPAALPRLARAGSDLSGPEHPLPHLSNPSLPRTPSGPPGESKAWEDKGGHRERGQARLKVGMEGWGVVSKAGRLEAPLAEREAEPASSLLAHSEQSFWGMQGWQLRGGWGQQR